MTYDQWKTTNPRDYEPELEPEPVILNSCWYEVADELPPLDQRVVCTDGHRYWLDMRTSYCPELTWGGHKALVWLPFEHFSLTQHNAEKERIKRMQTEPEIKF